MNCDARSTSVDLSLVYQPKFDLRDGDIVGVEALVRWPHRDRGLLGPDHFLPLVREHGLMRAVTQLVLEKALDEVAGWHAQGFDVPVAVNIFAPSLGDLELPRQIARALSERNLRPEALTVEITEDLLLDNLDRTRTVLNRLRENGVRIAIDDFGSGYSALWYLRELPVDEVKLDRQFIAPVLVDPRAAAIVRAVIDLAHVAGGDDCRGGCRRRPDGDQTARVRLRGRAGVSTTVRQWPPRRCSRCSRRAVATAVARHLPQPCSRRGVATVQIIC